MPPIITIDTDQLGGLPKRCGTETYTDATGREWDERDLFKKLLEKYRMGKMQCPSEPPPPMVFKFSAIGAGEQNMNLATPFQVRASVVELGNFGANQITSLVGSVEIFDTTGVLLHSNLAMPFDNNWQDTIPLSNGASPYRILYKVDLPTGETCEFNTWVKKNSAGSSYGISGVFYNAITDNMSVTVTGATVSGNAANSGEIDYKNDGSNEITGAAALAPFSIMPADLSAGGSHELKATWHSISDIPLINANPCHKIVIASYN